MSHLNQAPIWDAGFSTAGALYYQSPRPVTRMGRAVGVVMAVRNEEVSISGALGALGKQSVPPAVVVVVDDGSTDGTWAAIAKTDSLPFPVQIVSLPPHEGNDVGKPELARTLNAGLRVIRDRARPFDYVMELGSDHSLPPDYIEKLLGKMESNPRLAVASGWIVDEPYTGYAPRGSGMLVSVEFWRRANGIRFPLTYGWESWVFLKAIRMGYATRSFRDVQSRVSRRTSLKKGVLYGRGMYALGYDWVFALGRCLMYAARSPRSGLEMWRGYVDHRGVQRTDVSDWVGAWQRRMMLARVRGILFRRGRK